MKSIVLFLGLTATASANIIFHHYDLHCNLTSPKIYHGCFRGQECLEDGDCVPLEEITYPLSFRSASTLQVRDGISQDGTCGPAHGNTICDPKSTVYTGGCCSQYGWCGNTPEHCGTGCISGCSGTSPPSQPTGTAPRPDGKCGSVFSGATCDPKGPYGGCCSQYGFCGTTPDHCSVSNGCQSGCADGTPTQTGPSSTATSGEPVLNPVGGGAGGAVTTDGTCGATNHNTVCGNWSKGNCCSAYGFCGNTDAHCGAGCQSGDCFGPPAVPVPGPSPAPAASNPGAFYYIGDSGVPAMHAALMPNGRVVFLDKLENYTQLKTSNGMYAMSSEFDAVYSSKTYGKAAPLYYKTNAFCAGGTFLADGRLISIGGNAPLLWLDPNIGDGFNAIRYLTRSSTDPKLNGGDWFEAPNVKLASNRWYPTAQTMPDGTVFVASGSLNGLDPGVQSNNNPTYEILDRNGISNGRNIPMDILQKNQPYYMYPFVHLMRDGNLFIFAAKSCQIFNVQTNTIVKQLPGLSGDYRTYPNTGGSVLLPLSSKNNWEPEIIICGGGAYQDISSPTDPSCGRIAPLSNNPHWEMDSMPQGRGMVEGTLLPDGKVLWLNGGNRGAQGFGLMSSPTQQALLYDPAKPLGQRWETLATSNIPRLYHSVALLMQDGSVMVAGSNPVEMPKTQPDAQNPFVTEFRVEQYVPAYMDGAVNKYRPSISSSPTTIRADGSTFQFSFSLESTSATDIRIALYHGGFVTHSLHMGHRMVYLDAANFAVGQYHQNIVVNGPPNNNVAPPGPYLLFVVTDGLPSEGKWVTVV